MSKIIFLQPLTRRNFLEFFRGGFLNQFPRTNQSLTLMAHSSPNRVVSSRNRIRFRRKPVQNRWILVGSIAPVGLALGIIATAADITVPPNLSLNSDGGAPLFNEGLREGVLTNAGNNFTDPNPNNSSPELGLRMGQSTATGADAWGDNKTWVYTGQIFTGPLGILSFAANNDDNDWLKINGSIVIQDTTWYTTNAAVVTGLTANSWVDFEYRVGNGGGGAGPSGQNLVGGTGGSNGANWTTSLGVVYSFNDENKLADPNDPNSLAPSLDANDYDGGRPTEQAGGGPTLFRYLNGLGFNDDLHVTASGTVTTDGSALQTGEQSLRFENTAAVTLTVNDGTGGHKTFSFANGTTLAPAASSPITISGTSDVRLGRVTDGALTGVVLIAGGPGQLILDNIDTSNLNDLDGTALQAGAGGHLTIRGDNGVNPVE